VQLAGALVVLALATCVVVPRRVVVSPAITITVRDDGGAPVQGIPVVRDSAHYSVEEVGHHDEATTDVHGVATFPIRDMRLSRAREWTSAARHLAQSVDSSSGPRSWLIVSLPGVGRNGVSLFPARGEERAEWRCVVGVGCERAR
jgi:hypothetical protein